MGVYVYEPEVLNYIEPGTYLDFPDLVLRLIDKGERVASYPCDDCWMDIGRQEDYVNAQKTFVKMQERFLPKPFL
jgi:NDP-sugar pyrophosphorylase family protein